jgi:hypothetical protein
MSHLARGPRRGIDSQANTVGRRRPGMDVMREASEAAV